MLKTLNFFEKKGSDPLIENAKNVFLATFHTKVLLYKEFWAF